MPAISFPLKELLRATFHPLSIRQQLHHDIAARGFRLRTDRVRLRKERFGLLLVDAGELSIERRVDEVD
jgi:hypothetical protein